MEHPRTIGRFDRRLKTEITPPGMQGPYAASVHESDKPGKPGPDDDRPPICPACGVTMGIFVDADGTTRHACLKCGFPDEPD